MSYSSNSGGTVVLLAPTPNFSLRYTPEQLLGVYSRMTTENGGNNLEAPENLRTPLFRRETAGPRADVQSIVLSHPRPPTLLSDVAASTSSTASEWSSPVPVAVPSPPQSRSPASPVPPSSPVGIRSGYPFI